MWIFFFVFSFKYRNTIKIIILLWYRKGQLGRNKNFVWQKTEKSAKWICIRCTNTFGRWLSKDDEDQSPWAVHIRTISVELIVSIVLYYVLFSFLSVIFKVGHPKIYQNKPSLFTWFATTLRMNGRLSMPDNYHIQKELFGIIIWLYVFEIKIMKICVVKLFSKASCKKYVFFQNKKKMLLLFLKFFFFQNKEKMFLLF